MNNKFKKAFYILHFTFLIFLIFSCTKPEPTNPYDPNSGHETIPMQGQLVLTELSDSQVELKWQLNSSIVGSYIINRKVNSGSYDFLAEVNAETDEYTDVELLTTNTYSYQVIGANDEVQTEPISNSISTTFTEITDFNTQQQNIFTADITWAHNCNYEEGYILERREISSREHPLSRGVDSEGRRGVSSKLPFDLSRRNEVKTERGERKRSFQRGLNSPQRDFIEIANLPANATQYTDDTLTPNQTYEYRIVAYTTWNESPEKTVQQLMQFPQPSDFTVTQDNVHTFTLNWQDESDGEQGYKIERKIDEGEYEVIATLDPDIETYTDDINSRNTFENVYYRLYAYYSTETSSIVENNSIISFEPITNLAYEKLTIQTIQLSWDDTNEDEDGFVVEKKVNEGDWEQIADITETQWTDEDAEINQNLQYRVKVYNGENSTDFVETDIIDNTFPAPSNLQIMQDNVHTFSLIWNDHSIGEEGFTIERKIDEGNYELIQTNAENDTTYTDDINTRDSFEIVYYKIYAFYETSNSDSLVGNCSINFPAPTNLQYEHLTISSIELTWQDNSNDEDGFIIEKKLNEETWEQIADITETDWTDENAEINQNLQYRVQAYSGENSTDFVETEVIDNTIPAPTNLQIAQGNIHTFSLIWNDNCIGEEGFTIERKIDEGNYILIHTNAENDTTYTDDINTRDSFETVYYKIHAIYETSNSDSLVGSCSINFPAPTNLQYVHLTISSIKLTWQDNSDGEDGFKIDKKVGENAWQIEFAVVGENAEDWTDTSAEINEMIKYIVYAYSGTNNSDYVYTGEIDNAIPPPSNLQYQPLTISSIKLTWQDNSEGEDGFKIDKKVGTNAWLIEFTIVGEDIETWTDANAELNELLQYRVYAFSGTNNSDYVYTGEIDNAIPTPENLDYTINLTCEITLHWDYNITGIDGFKITRRVGNGTWDENFATIPSGIYEFIDAGLTIGETYKYKVQAYFSTYTSNFTSAISYTPHPAGMIFVQGGTFEMGDHYGEGSSDELPAHDVTIDAFFIDEFEVTHTEFIEFLNDFGVSSNGSYNGTELIDMDDSDCAIDYNDIFYFGGSNYASSTDCPVIEITWYGAVVFCNWKSQQEDLTPCYNLSDWICDFNANGYRLPTEAEWEYAARGGVNWTDDYRYSGCHNVSDLPNYAWISSNSNNQTHPVGTKLPNQLEIHDMSGNVWEWCNDWYDSSYYSSSPANNPTGPPTGTSLVLRGGSWHFNVVYYCRVADRYSVNPNWQRQLLRFSYH